MAKEAKYDDFAFAYFVIAVLSIILIPTTYFYLKKWKKILFSKHQGICNCVQCHKKTQLLNEQAKQINIWSVIKFSMFIILWILFFYFFSLPIQTPSQPQFDPYEILGIGLGATKEEIKKTFRDLSKLYHPDKNPHPEAAEKYILIHKAYDTLTDDDIREKWERYGNPDGPQAFSIGIALPSFLVSSRNSALILALYVFFLVIVFPIVVLYFWSRQKEMAGNALMKRTMQLFVSTIEEKMKFKKLMNIFPAAEEYRLGLRIRSSDEEGINKIKPFLPVDEPVPKVNKKTNRMIAPYIYKNKILFYAHFTRLHEKISPTLREDIQFLLSKASLVLAGLVEASVLKQSYASAHETLLISQMVVQAVWANTYVQYNSFLLQLPHLNAEILQQWKKRVSGMKIQQFLNKKEEFLTPELGFSPDKVRDIENVAQQLPIDLEVSFKLIIPGSEDEEEEKEKTKKDGKEKDEKEEEKEEKDEKEEKEEKEKSLSRKGKQGNTLIQRKKLKKNELVTNNSNFNSKQESSSKQKEDEIIGGTIMAILGKVSRPSKPRQTPIPTAKISQRYTLNPNRNPFKETETEPIEAHAPYFPLVKNEVWYAFITTDGENILNLQKIGSLRDKTEIFIPISTPPRTGVYNIHVHLICDSYLGFDKHETLRLKIHKDMPKDLLQPNQQPQQAKKTENQESSEEEEEEEEEANSSNSESD